MRVDQMTGRERTLTALNHQEPDRVPYDLGSTQVTGIAVNAYDRLRTNMGLADKPTEMTDLIQQLARVDEE